MKGCRRMAKRGQFGLVKQVNARSANAAGTTPSHRLRTVPDIRHAANRFAGASSVSGTVEDSINVCLRERPCAPFSNGRD